MSMTWNGNDPEPFAVDAVLEQMEWDEEKRKTGQAVKQINAQRPRQTVPYRRARLWQFGLLALIVSFLFAWFVFKPMLWAISQVGK